MRSARSRQRCRTSGNSESTFKWGGLPIHATYDESIARMLNVFEAVNREVPLGGAHWFFDHCETVSERSLERIKALGGGIAIQNRMAFQGEYFLDR